MIEMNHPQLSISRQCEILSVHRSGLYYQPVPESAENLAIMRLLDEQYYQTPFYGIRKLTEWLQNMDYTVNHKRVRRLMKLMGWKTLYREANTSEAYISLLKGHEIQISMDGKGRALDNIYIERLWRSVKYENIYLNVYEDGLSLYQGLKQYFEFYNNERLHESLDYRAPKVLYRREAA